MTMEEERIFQNYWRTLKNSARLTIIQFPHWRRTRSWKLFSVSMCDLAQRFIYCGSLFHPHSSRETTHLPVYWYLQSIRSIRESSALICPEIPHGGILFETMHHAELLLGSYRLNFERSTKIGRSDSAIHNREVRSAILRASIKVVQKLSGSFDRVIGQGSVRGHSRSQVT